VGADVDVGCGVSVGERVGATVGDGSGVSGAVADG
jgi:hypothetical protein